MCPIGGMNGMFAKLAVTELRARQGVCSGECRCGGREGTGGRCGHCRCGEGGGGALGAGLIEPKESESYVALH